MASSKTYTWKEFERGMDKLPEEIKRLALDEVRDNMVNLSRILETVADARAYDTAPGTKASTRNTRAKGRLYGKRLAPTIMRFKNRNNPLKAYAVVGNQTWPRGGAIYAPMQLGGYRPGRPKLSAKAAVLDKFGRTKSGGATSTGRAALAMSKRRIPGKDYFRKADAQVGNQVQTMAMRKSVAILDKYLARI